MQGLISPSTPLLPAPEITLIYFVSHLAKTVSYNTIKLYLFAVQDLHWQNNFPLKTSLKCLDSRRSLMGSNVPKPRSN